MSGSFANWLKHMVRAFLVAVPLVVGYGFLFPWPAADRALSRYPGETPIMIAGHYHSHSWENAGRSEWMTRTEAARSYILFPSVFTHPKIVTVSQTNNNAPTVSESGGAVILIGLAGLIAFAGFGVWYFWIRTPEPDRLRPEDAKTFYR